LSRRRSAADRAADGVYYGLSQAMLGQFSSPAGSAGSMEMAAGKSVSVRVSGAWEGAAPARRGL